MKILLTWIVACTLIVMSVLPCWAERREDGIYAELYPTGEIRMRMTYHKGVPNGPFNSYYRDGTLLAEGLYINGLLEKKAHEYYPNGTLKMEVNYRHGKISGWVRMYAEDGTMIKESEYFNGKLDGITRDFDAEGHLI